MRWIYLLILWMLLNGCRPEPSVTISQGDLLRTDTFDSAVGWDANSSATVSIGVSNSAYRIRTDSSQYVIGRSRTETYTDVIIDVDTLQLTTEDTNGYGLICRAASTITSSNGYYFLIGADGSYSIRKGQHGEVKSLVAWSRLHTEPINTGAASNRIRAVCIGDYLALYVNGELLAETHDRTFKSGTVGFAAVTKSSTITEIAFDNLALYAGTIE